MYNAALLGLIACTVNSLLSPFGIIKASVISLCPKTLTSFVIVSISSPSIVKLILFTVDGMAAIAVSGIMPFINILILAKSVAFSILSFAVCALLPTVTVTRESPPSGLMLEQPLIIKKRNINNNINSLFIAAPPMEI